MDPSDRSIATVATKPYQLAPDEHVAALNEALSRVPKTVVWATVAVVGCLLVRNIRAAFAGQLHWPSFKLLVFEVLVTVFAVLVLLAQRLRGRSIEAVREHYTFNPSPTNIVTFHQGGISCNSNSQETTWDWACVKSIRFSEMFVFIWLENRTILYVPTSAFGSLQSIEQVMQLARFHALGIKIETPTCAVASESTVKRPPTSAMTWVILILICILAICVAVIASLPPEFRQPR